MSDMIQKARLELEVSSKEIKELQRIFNAISAEMGGLEGAAERVANEVDRAGRSMQSAGKKGKKDVASQGSEWDLLAKKIRETTERYQEYVRKTQGTGKAPIGFRAYANRNGITDAEIERYNAANGEKGLAPEQATRKAAQERAAYNKEVERTNRLTERLLSLEGTLRRTQAAGRAVGAGNTEEAVAATRKDLASATQRLAHIEQEYRKAQEPGTLVKDRVAATRELNSAQSEATVAQKRHSAALRAHEVQVKKALRGAGQLASAEEALRRAQEGGRVASATLNSDRVSETREALARATDNLTAAEQRYKRAQGSESSTQEKISATRDLERAQRSLNSAIKAHESATKRQADYAKKLEADTLRLKSAEDGLSRAYARQSATKAEGTERSVAAARRSLADATDRIIAAEKEKARIDKVGSLSDRAAATSKVTSAIREQERAIRTLNSQMRAQEGHLTSTRYLMYDVSRTALRMSGAMTAIMTATAVASASFESAFTGVQRTSGIAEGGVDSLREELIALTRDMPTSFEDIAGIATMGAQLDIASSDLEFFTEQVSKFSATADGVTAEETAEGFGRIGQLLQVPVSAYENLGSAILYAGNSSIATESEVLDYTQRLAAAGREAGFTAEEVIALGSTMASTGIGMEASQGALQRMFQQINRDVSSAGEGLDNLASVAGMSAESFAAAWSDKPQKAFSALVNGLSHVSDMTGTLDSLGIKETREVRAITLLAQNTDLYNKLLTETASAYAEGTYLADSYGVVVDDLASQWAIFINSIKEFGAAVGNAIAPALKFILPLITSFINTLTKLSETGLGKILLQAGGAITVVAIGITGLIGTLAAARGAMAAFRLALSQSSTQLAVVRNQMAATAGTARALGGAALGAARSFGLMKTALLTTGVGAAVVALGAVAAHFATLNDEVNDLADSFSGITSALTADTKTWLETGEAAGTLSVDLGEATDEMKAGALQADNFAALLGQASNAQQELAKRTGETTLAIGEQTEEFLRSQFRQSEALNDFLGTDVYGQGPNVKTPMSQFLRDAGIDFNEMIRIGVQQSDPEEASRLLQEYLTKTFELAGAKVNYDPFGNISSIKAADGMALTGKQLEKLIGLFENTGAATQGAIDKAVLYGDIGKEGLDVVTDSALDLADGMTSAGDSVDDILDPLYALWDAALGVEDSFYKLGQSLAENGEDWNIYSEGGRANIDAVRGAMEALAIEADGDTAATATSFQALYEYLVDGGYGTREELDFLRQAIIRLVDASGAGLAQLKWISGGAAEASRRTVQFASDVGAMMQKALKGEKVEPPTIDFSGLKVPDLDKIDYPQREMESFTAGMADGLDRAAGSADRAAKKTRELREEIVTTADYANDLGSVMDRAFELRFGRQQAFDDIQDSWSKIRQESEEARKAVQEYKLELNGLKVDKSTLEYWLGVAQQYGDEKRAAELRQQIAEKNKEIAETEDKMSDERDKASRSLTGNSDAARANRDTILDLVSKYQDYAVELANSGLSQDELKRKTTQLREDFIRQATQMGFNRGEVMKYAASFDDMKLAIDRVPRNVTIEANAEPAIVALREFAAKAKQEADRAGDRIANGVKSGTDRAAGAIRHLGDVGLCGGDYEVRPYLNPAALTNLRDRIQDALNGRVRPGHNLILPGGRPEYAEGGYTGPGSKYQAAGTVHAGEFVFNAQATKALSPGFLSKMHTAAQSGKMLLPGGSGSGFTELGPSTIQALSQIFVTRLDLDGKQLATSAASQFRRANTIGAA